MAPFVLANASRKNIFSLYPYSPRPLCKYPPSTSHQTSIFNAFGGIAAAFSLVGRYQSFPHLLCEDTSIAVIDLRVLQRASSHLRAILHNLQRQLSLVCLKGMNFSYLPPYFLSIVPRNHLACCLRLSEPLLLILSVRSITAVIQLCFTLMWNEI